MITRRRFITISAALAAMPSLAQARPIAPSWAGHALGARATIRIDHPDADAITARVRKEIDRLEDILSLYRADSALSRLNRDGQLVAPPFELLDCLDVAHAVHDASKGRLDPTVQVLWQVWAEAAAKGGQPDNKVLKAALANTGWNRVRRSADVITMQSGMAMTLNGIGQGYVADRVAALLAAEGLDNIFIDTGEFRALGGQPSGDAWPVTLTAGPRITLKDRALATSAPLGTTFDQAGTLGHILDPQTGYPTQAPWKSATISAPTAALADALSTAACLAEDRNEVDALIARFPQAKLENLERG